jgi:hypothetical protein
VESGALQRLNCLVVATDPVNHRRLASRGIRLVALLCAVIVCSAAAQDSVTGDPPPCAASDLVVTQHAPADWSAGDNVDTTAAEAPSAFVPRVRLARPSFSLAASPTPLSLRVDIPPELAL